MKSSRNATDTELREVGRAGAPVLLLRFLFAKIRHSRWRRYAEAQRISSAVAVAQIAARLAAARTTTSFAAKRLFGSTVATVNMMVRMEKKART